MRSYWVKIAIGALAIFAVGYTGIVAFRKTKDTVRGFTEGRGDIVVPLAFVPFKLDQEELGTFRKLVIHRNAPDHPTGFDVTVRLKDAASVDRLRGCHLTVDDPRRINEHTTFLCAANDSGLAQFGSVEFMARGTTGEWSPAMTVPIMLAQSAIDGMRGSTRNYTAEAARIKGDRLRQLGDSMRILGERLRNARTDGDRIQIETEMKALQERMSNLDDISDLADSLSETVQKQVEEGLRAGGVDIGPNGIHVKVPGKAEVSVGPDGVATKIPPAPKPAVPPKP